MFGMLDRMLHTEFDCRVIPPADAAPANLACRSVVFPLPTLGGVEDDVGVSDDDDNEIE